MLKRTLHILALALFYLPNANSQGLTNNGGIIKVSSGSIIRVSGNQGNFANNKSNDLNGKVQNNGKIFVQGNWENNTDAGNLFINRSGTGEVIFNGTTMQTIEGLQTTNFENLRFDNSNGNSPQIKIMINTIVEDQLTMISGNIDLSGNKVTLGTSPETPGSLLHSETAASGWMYNGSITRYFGIPALSDRNIGGMFPVGSQDNFRPFYVSYPLTDLISGGTITLSHTNATTSSLVNFTDGSSTVVQRDNSYWTCYTDGGIDGGTFNLSAEGTGFNISPDVADFRLTLAGSIAGTAGINIGTTLDPQINRTGLSLENLSNDFYPASVSSSSPLPIELVSYEAMCNGNSVNINWSTAAESNNDFFTIYKSLDEKTWTEFRKINGAGNSNQLRNYSITDNDYLGDETYYQLKQTDFNGNTTLFNILSVDCPSVSNIKFSIYPNPVNGILYIKTNLEANDYNLKILNQEGQPCYSTIFSGNTSIDVSELRPALYYVIITNQVNGEQHKQKIVVL
jgi:hypothetical protein